MSDCQTGLPVIVPYVMNGAAATGTEAAAPHVNVPIFRVNEVMEFCTYFLIGPKHIYVPILIGFI